jgi:hypothetical protein
MWYSIFVSSILRFSISETECTTPKNTPSLLASIASMRLFYLTFHILLRGRDLAYNTFVPFNFIPTFFRTRRAKLREQSLFIRWRD